MNSTNLNESIGDVRRLRQFIQQQLIDSIDIAGDVVNTDTPALQTRIGHLLDEVQDVTECRIESEARGRIIREILEDLDGMGPLTPLMMDDAVTDILVNGPAEVWVDTPNGLQLTDTSFDDEQHLYRFLDRIVDRQGRDLDARSPMVDARLKDGSRVHALIPPLCAKGPVVSIRKFNSESLTSRELISSGFLNEAMLEFLKLAVEGGLNMVISGGSASGKTTLLNVAAGFVPNSERVVTIEETSELRIKHPHVVNLEGRPENSHGRGSITLGDLVRNALRMRADRIIIGEVRGIEVWDMLQAMNVGHDGSLTTLHANSPTDALRRLELLSMFGDVSLPRVVIREAIGSAINLFVHLRRYRDGTRRVINISEVNVVDGKPVLNELFSFQTETRSGVAQGCHVYTGTAVKCLQTIKDKGFDMCRLESMLEAGH